MQDSPSSVDTTKPGFHPTLYNRMQCVSPLHGTSILHPIRGMECFQLHQPASGMGGVITHNAGCQRLLSDCGSIEVEPWTLCSVNRCSFHWATLVSRCNLFCSSYGIKAKFYKGLGITIDITNWHWSRKRTQNFTWLAKSFVREKSRWINWSDRVLAKTGSYTRVGEAYRSQLLS